MFIAADNFVTAARYSDIAGAGAACQIAADALAKSQKHTPSPEPALNTKLQQAITHYQAGVRDCVAGKQDRDPVETGKATVSINQGSTDLQAAVGIIEEDLAAEGRARPPKCGPRNSARRVSRWCARSTRRSWRGWRLLQVSRTPGR